jgi:hypothetical protein
MLAGFETYDASIKEVVAKISKAGIIFNKATAYRLDNPIYVEFGMDRSGKRIALQAVSKKSDQSLNFTTHSETGITKWGSKDILNEIYKIAELDPSLTYRVTGEAVEKENAVIFDLGQAQVIKGRCRL